MRFVTGLTLFTALASSAIAQGADSGPTAYQAAVHLSGKIGSRPSASKNERRAHNYVAARFRAAGLAGGGKRLPGGGGGRPPKSGRQARTHPSRPRGLLGPTPTVPPRPPAR